MLHERNGVAAARALDAPTGRARLRAPLIVVIVAAIALTGTFTASAGAHRLRAHALSLRATPFIADGVGAKPLAETETVTEVRRSSAILNGTVNPEGSNVKKCQFAYGQTPSFGKTVQCANLPGSGEAGIPVYAVLEGLEEGTTYYVKIEAENANGVGVGAHTERFTTLPSEPKADTEPANDITRTTAKLNGFVNPDGAEVTECFFEYGQTKTYGHTVSCRALPGSGETLVPVSAEIEKLKESEAYDFRLVAVNAYGEHFGGNEEFTTLPSAPRVHTEAATKVTHSSALVHGTVNPNDLEVTECFFEYGTTQSYGHTAACSPSPGSGEEPVEVTAELIALEEHKTYFFQLVAKNASSSQVLGGKEMFATLPTKPKAVTRSALDVGPESAVLKGTVNPNAANVTACEFEYGTTLTFGKSINCSELPGAGEEGVPVSASVSGLKPETTYYYRLRAENADGSDYGGVNRLITTPPGLAPAVTKVSPSKGAAVGGTVVSIKGTGFSGASEVTFGSKPAAKYEVTSADTISATAPPGTTGTVDVRVSTPDGTSEAVSADHFTYGGPTITAFTPKEGPKAGGTKVTITGSGFNTLAGKTTFEFGTAPGTSVSCSSSSSCTVLTPADGRTGGVRVGVQVANKKQKTKRGVEFTYTE